MRRAEIFKRSARPMRWILLSVALLGGGGMMILAWNLFYQNPSVAKKDIFQRIERRAAIFESRLIENPRAISKHLEYIEQSNALVAQALKRHPANSWSYYLQSVFIFL